jgi:hypothetical protein
VQLPNGGTISIDSTELANDTDVFIPWIEVCMPQYAATPKFDPAADMNHDDAVSLDDVALFASRWLATTCDVSNYHCDAADIDQDGDVDFDDLDELAANWLKRL